MEHEPVEIRANRQAMLSLALDITGFRVEELPGGQGEVSAVWFQADQLYHVSVDVLGLATQFEVFTLLVKTPAEIQLIQDARAREIEKAWAGIKEAGLPISRMDPPLAIAPAGELTQWPFRSWRLDILKRMAFVVGLEHLPETSDAMDNYLVGLRPGEAPSGSVHTCLTASGLLFTSDKDARLLLVADGTPGFMRVTTDQEAVQSYLRQCIAVPVSEYVPAT